MTVVAALVHDGKVTMGADTASETYDTTILGKRKIRFLPWDPKHDTGALPPMLAAAGNGALIDYVVRHVKAARPDRSRGDQALNDWASAVAEAITEVCADATPPLAGLAQDVEGGQSPVLDGTMLLAHQGHMWLIQAHIALPITQGYAAIGSGAHVALGYLLAVADKIPPRTAVTRAVRAACTVIPSCAVDDAGPVVCTA